MSHKIYKCFFDAAFILMLVIPSAAQSGSAPATSGDMNTNNNSYNPVYNDQVNVSVGGVSGNSQTANSGTASGQIKKTSKGASSWGPVLHPSAGLQKPKSSENTSKDTASEVQSNSAVSPSRKAEADSPDSRHSASKSVAIRRTSPQLSASESEKTLGGSGLHSTAHAFKTSGVTSRGKGISGNKAKTRKKRGLFSDSKKSEKSLSSRH